MALAADGDKFGVFGVMECDWSGCHGHLALRPVEPLTSARDLRELLEEVISQAEDDGWLLVGQAYCPRHAPEVERVRLERPVTVGDGFMWARVTGEGVKGGQRPS